MQVRVRDCYFIAEQPAPAHPEGRAALRIVLVTVPRASRSCEHFPDGLEDSSRRAFPDVNASTVTCFALWGLGPSLEAAQGQMNDFFSQLPYSCHPEEVASVGD